jgi:endonuclease YncB( thermonuclease family)
MGRSRRIIGAGRRNAAVAAAVTICCIIAGYATAQDRTRDCVPKDAITATAKSVSDGRSFILADGREVQLAAIEVPASMRAPVIAALATHVTGRTVRLSPLAPATDRYGRLNMHAFGALGAGTVSIEAALLAQGLAFVSLSGSAACLPMLNAAERAARRGKLGLWGSDGVKADNPAAILAGRGGFAVVEGKILSVRESGGTIYLNFGRRWTEDFTVTILKRNERKFTEAGLAPKQLEGRTVRIRGVVEERGGPWIEAVVPQQIEMADGS